MKILLHLKNTHEYVLWEKVKRKFLVGDSKCRALYEIRKLAFHLNYL